jgi:plastocyanin
MKKLTIASLLVASVLVAACGSDNTTSSSGSTGTSGTSGSSGSSGTSGTSGTTPTGGATVTVKSNSFTPASVTIKAGEKVTWTWAGGSHDVVSGNNCTDDAKFKSSLQTSGTFEFTFATAGTYPYFCTPHCSSANMVGTVIVQ